MLSAGCVLPVDAVYSLPDELEGKLSPWEADIYFLEHELPLRHINVYHTLSEAEYSAGIAELKALCPGMSDEERWVAISSFVASIGDSHTQYALPFTRAFPLNLVVTEEGVFVTAALEENRGLVRDSGEAAMAELVAIDGMPLFPDADSDTSSVYATLYPVLSHENDGAFREMLSSALLHPELLFGAGITEEMGSCEMTFRYQDGNAEAVALVARELSGFRELDWVVYYDEAYPADRSVLPHYLRYSNSYYWGAWLADEQTLYILYNRCANAEDQSFRAFTEELLQMAAGESVLKLVVDLRNNAGGNSAVIRPLYALLANELPNVSLYTVMDATTYSSALMNAATLKRTYGAVLVGEPSGGRPNHYGEVESIELLSGNRISWSTRFFTTVPGDNGEALYPDMAIPVHAEAFFGLEDEVMAWILAQ